MFMMLILVLKISLVISAAVFFPYCLELIQTFFFQPVCPVNIFVFTQHLPLPPPLFGSPSPPKSKDHRPDTSEGNVAYHTEYVFKLIIYRFDTKGWFLSEIHVHVCV